MAVDRARVSANMAKWRKAASMVGRTAAGLDVWQRNARERLRLRREALLKPPARRTEADVVLLETVLSRVKFVRELTMKTRMDLCKLTGYARHGAGETLFRQGDAGEFFYVVLSGSVDVFIRDPGGREHLVATLFNGDSFGELALMHEGNTRGATIVAKEDCEFLTLGREDYGAILRTQSEKSISEKVAHLRSTPMFRHVEHDTVQSMAYVLAARTYPRNALVFKQGEEVEDVYFIAEGAARLVREVENRETLRRAGVTRRGPGCLFGKTRGRGHSWDEPPTPPGLANEWLDANEDGEDRFAPDAATESIDDATPLPGGSRRTSATVGANELAAASVAMADVSFGDSSDDDEGDFDDGASATSRSSRLSRESRMTDMESRFRGSFAAALSLGGGGDGTGGGGGTGGRVVHQAPAEVAVVCAVGEGGSRGTRSAVPRGGIARERGRLRGHRADAPVRAARERDNHGADEGVRDEQVGRVATGGRRDGGEVSARGSQDAEGVLGGRRGAPRGVSGGTGVGSVPDVDGGANRRGAQGSQGATEVRARATGRGPGRRRSCDRLKTRVSCASTVLALRALTTVLAD